MVLFSLAPRAWRAIGLGAPGGACVLIAKWPAVLAAGHAGNNWNGSASCAPRLRINAADLRAFEGEVVHQPLGVEDEADHRIGDLVGVDRAAGADRNQHHRAIDANPPAVDALEI